MAGKNLPDGFQTSIYRLYITGSNAKMLSKEIATVLGGRFLIKEIFDMIKFSVSFFLSIKLYPK